MKINTHWPEATKHLIALAFGWCLLSILLGLFYAFDALEASKSSLAITAFLKATTIAFLIGAIVLSIPIIVWKLRGKNEG